MTEEDHAVATLAAALAPASAAALLARLASADASEIAARAGRLAVLPRRERLAALALAIASAAGVPPASRAAAAAARERPPVAALLGTLARGRAPAGASPLLVRLCRERLGR